MPDPKPYGSESDGGEEVPCELVVAHGDAAELLELVEEALDQVALSVDLVVDHASQADIALRGDVGGCAGGLDRGDDRAGEVAAIGDHVVGQRHAFDQGRKGRLVGGLARREQQTDRQAVAIHDGVDLGAQSATRTTDGVIRAPFLPPAACWWARTIEESMR